MRFWICQHCGHIPEISSLRNGAEGPDVILTLPQGRDINGEDIQPVVEVLAESAFSHPGGKVSVRGGQDPYVDFPGNRAAQPLEFLFLQEAEQFCLERQREFADFIEKNGAAIGLFNPARLDLTAPVKAPFS